MKTITILLWIAFCGVAFGEPITINESGSFGQTGITDTKKPNSYEEGFRNGMECLALLNLELSIKDQRKTFGEMMKICRDRFGIKGE